MKYRVTIPMDGEAIYEVDADNSSVALAKVRIATKNSTPGDCCTSVRFTLLYCGATIEAVAAGEGMRELRGM